MADCAACQLVARDRKNRLVLVHGVVLARVLRVDGVLERLHDLSPHEPVHRCGLAGPSFAQQEDRVAVGADGSSLGVLRHAARNFMDVHSLLAGAKRGRV